MPNSESPRRRILVRGQWGPSFPQRVYKQWQEIFNHDTTLTAALLDRLLHHVETVVIEG